MIDFHSHVLSGIDDGSGDLLETRELLKMEWQQGVRQLLATPHFYAQQESVQHFLEKREKSRKQLFDLQKPDMVPELRMAAEVYYFPGMGQAKMLSSLCMEDRSLILVEMPFVQWTGEMYRDVKDIIEKQHLTVLLAHVERYYEFQKDRTIWEEMFALPLYSQINAGSLIKGGRKRRFSLKFIKAGHPVLLGTDCHNMRFRPPNLQEGREVLARKLGNHILEEIDTLGRELWNHG